MFLTNLTVFLFVESIFLIGIIINLSSYIVGFYLILSKNYTKTFMKTIKEGWSPRYISTNILNISLLITSITIFWFMIFISSDQKKLTILEAIHLNIYVSFYVFLSSILLLPYSMHVSLQNYKKFKDLTSALGILSIWNGLDEFMSIIGGNFIFNPLTEISSFVRKNIVRSQINEVLITSIIWMVFEYMYKISIVLCLLFLQSAFIHKAIK